MSTTTTLKLTRAQAQFAHLLRSAGYCGDLDTFNMRDIRAAMGLPPGSFGPQVRALVTSGLLVRGVPTRGGWYAYRYMGTTIESTGEYRVTTPGGVMMFALWRDHGAPDVRMHDKYMLRSVHPLGGVLLNSMGNPVPA